MICLDVLLYADELWYPCTEKLYDFFPVMKLFFCRDQYDHYAAVFSHSAHYMAQHSCMLVLVVDRDVIFFNGFTHYSGDDVVFFLLYQAVLRVYDVMGALCKAADNGLSFFHAHRELHFVSVVPRSRAEGFMHGNVLLSADMNQGVYYLLFFHFELRFVGKVLKLAAAALFVNRTLWGCSVFTFLDNAQEFSRGIIFLYCFYDCLNLFSGQCPLYENGESVYSAYSFSACAEAFDIYFNALSFCDRNFFLQCVSLHSKITSDRDFLPDVLSFKILLFQKAPWGAK